MIPGLRSALSLDRLVCLAAAETLEFLFVIRNSKESAEDFALASWTMPSILRWRRVDPDECPSCGGTG
jgi:hypothetical protein